jgi:hypothetical protein
VDSVKILTFSAEYVYTHLDQNYAGVVVASGSYGTGAYTGGKFAERQIECGENRRKTPEISAKDITGTRFVAAPEESGAVSFRA